MDRPFPPAPGVRHAFHDVATGIRVHVAEAGPEDGPAIVLLHGWPQHWWCWRGVIGPLADAGFHVIAPDLRGSGWTDAPAGGYDKEQFASDMLALLDALGIEETVLVGHDWGGWTAQLMALRSPERFSRVVLCNIAPVWASTNHVQTALNVWRLAYQVVGLPVLGPWLQRRALKLAFAGLPAGDAREFVEAMREPGRAEAGSRIYRTFVRREILPLMRGAREGQRLTMPVRVLHGTGDPVIRRFQVEGFRERADRVEIEYLLSTGHFIVDEQPAHIAARVLDFTRSAAVPLSA